MQNRSRYYAEDDSSKELQRATGQAVNRENSRIIRLPAECGRLRVSVCRELGKSITLLRRCEFSSVKGTVLGSSRHSDSEPYEVIWKQNRCKSAKPYR